jgi:hypothetical protein
LSPAGTRVIAILLGGLLSTAATADCRPQVLPAQQPSATTWRLTLHTTGGFIAADRELTLASDGELKAIDRRRQREVAKKASPAELDRIASMVAGLKSVEGDRSGVCNDCFEYALSVQTGGRSMAASLNDSNLDSSPAGPLVKALMAILNRELSQ